MSRNKRIWVDHKRRVVVRVKTLPKIEDLYRLAYDAGMTVNEYVQYLASLNANHSKRRNRSTMYDLGPIPYRKDKDDDEHS